MTSQHEQSTLGCHSSDSDYRQVSECWNRHPPHPTPRPSPSNLCNLATAASAEVHATAAAPRPPRLQISDRDISVIRANRGLTWPPRIGVVLHVISPLPFSSGEVVYVFPVRFRVRSRHYYSLWFFSYFLSSFFFYLSLPLFVDLRQEPERPAVLST